MNNVVWHQLRNHPARRLLLLLLDGAIAALSLWLSMLLRFEGQIPDAWRLMLPNLLLLLILCRVGASFLLRLHRWSFLLSGLTDGMRLGVSGLLGTGLFLLSIYLLRLTGPPRSVVVLEMLLTTAVMTGMRFLPRLAWIYRADLLRARRPETLRTVIVGAGAAGEALFRDLQRSQDHSYQVIGFVDDDRSKKGTILGGRPVLGSVSDLTKVVENHRVSKVLIAIPRLSAQRVREILSLCADLDVRFKILPVSYIYLQDRSSLSLLHDLTPEDLLPREPVHFEETREIVDRVVLVTGAAGSIGSEICRQVMEAKPRRLVMVDMNENELYLMVRRFSSRYANVEFVAEVADIREARRVTTLFDRYQPQDVFHAAAHKQVPLMETAPCEAIKNNVLGTLNVVRAADSCGARRLVFISTDKAVQPKSVMGASKRVAEMVVRTFEQRSKTQFCAVRFGNVLDSAGSVVPLFREQIAAGGPVTVTHPEVRRYFMTISEAVGLVLKAAYGDYGPLCILKMGEQMRILDLARYMITMSGHIPEADIPIHFTGLRPGEKLSEELMTGAEKRSFVGEDQIFVTHPALPSPEFEALVQRLIAAACNEDGPLTLELLRQLVPECEAGLGFEEQEDQVSDVLELDASRGIAAGT